MKTMIIALISVFTSFAFAKGYSDSGCGLGLLVVGRDGNQILSATLNATGMQTFGILSVTSGCVDDGAIAQNKQVPAFIEVNKMSLATDAARGEGETLAGLAQLMGCQTQKLGPAIKANYNKVFVETNMEPTQIEAKIRSLNCGA